MINFMLFAFYYNKMAEAVRLKHANERIKHVQTTHSLLESNLRYNDTGSYK